MSWNNVDIYILQLTAEVLTYVLFVYIAQVFIIIALKKMDWPRVGAHFTKEYDLEVFRLLYM